MCKELVNNRRILAGLIYSRCKFTVRGMERAYKEKTGSMLVDARLGVSGYIRYLHELGVLRLMGGMYVVDEDALQTF